MVDTTISLQPVGRRTIETELANKQGIASGLLVAFCIISLWMVSLSILLHLDIAKLPVWLMLPAILWQTFLYTGLFITGHDAMHGAVDPENPKLNHFIGSLAVLSYGTFSYRELLKKHWQHHRYPASSRDPDFHDGEHKHPIAWYFYFMSRYWNWKQLIAMPTVFCLLHYLFQVPLSNLSLFWGIPPILSSVQLFYFGTFLTHREPEAGYQNPHRAKTTALSTFWSFITCYHFGYHQEHHEHPEVPWWRLPSVYSAKPELGN